MTEQRNAAVHVPAKSIPVPRSVSAEAQAMLGRGPLGPGALWPPLDQVEAWRATVTAMNEGALALFASLGATAPEPPIAPQIQDVDLDGVAAYVAIPAGVGDGYARAVLNIHGGA